MHSCRKCGKEMRNIEDECNCVTAEWSIELWITCPHCGHYFDYFDTDDCRSGGYENFDTEGIWCTNSFDKNMAIHIDCPECEKPFVVDKTEIN